MDAQLFPLVSRAVLVEDAQFRLSALKQIVCDRTAACEWLSNKVASYRILSLYQSMFPDEWRRSTASLVARSPGHSPREIEFFEWLADRMPISDCLLDDACEQYIDSLPIFDMGISWQCGEGYEYLTDEWQVLIPLTQEGSSWMQHGGEELLDWYQASFGLNVDTVQDASCIVERAMRKRFAQLSTPLDRLPLALRVLDKRTHNVWLDAPNEGYWGECTVLYDLTEANLRYLVHEWRKAEKILSYVQPLISWLKADLATHFAILINHWNQPYD